MKESSRQRSREGGVSSRGDRECKGPEISKKEEKKGQESQCDQSEASKRTIVGNETEETDSGRSRLVLVGMARHLHCI